MVNGNALYVLPCTGMNLARVLSLRLPYKTVFRGDGSYLLVCGNEGDMRGAETFQGNAPVLTEEDAKWAESQSTEEMRQQMNSDAVHRNNMRFLVAFDRELEKEKRREGKENADTESTEESLQPDKNG